MRLLRARELFNSLFHGESALVELVIAHEGPQMHLLRGAGKLFDLGLILFVLPAFFLETPLTLFQEEAVVAAVELRFPSTSSMQRWATTSRKYRS